MKYPDQIKAFGSHLKRLREAKGFSQQALADTANITKMSVLRIENGKQAPTLDTLLVLSNALEIPFLDLVNFEGGLE